VFEFGLFVDVFLARCPWTKLNLEYKSCVRNVTQLLSLGGLLCPTVGVPVHYSLAGCLISKQLGFDRHAAPPLCSCFQICLPRDENCVKLRT